MMILRFILCETLVIMFFLIFIFHRICVCRT